jgi:hypothetical protein
MNVEDSAVAKSVGRQEEKNKIYADTVLVQVLEKGTKISKTHANYHELDNKSGAEDSCAKCKFNLGDEKKCHVVEGEINNKYGISKFFSAKGVGMLPGDIVWEYIKRTGKKLQYNSGNVIPKGADGFQCKDYKYYLYYKKCLLIKGNFLPDMSCGYIVKVGNGTEL